MCVSDSVIDSVTLQPTTTEAKTCSSFIYLFILLTLNIYCVILCDTLMVGTRNSVASNSKNSTPRSNKNSESNMAGEVAPAWAEKWKQT